MASIFDTLNMNSGNGIDFNAAMNQGRADVLSSPEDLLRRSRIAAAWAHNDAYAGTNTPARIGLAGLLGAGSPMAGASSTGGRLNRGWAGSQSFSPNPMNRDPSYTLGQIAMGPKPDVPQMEPMATDADRMAAQKKLAIVDGLRAKLATESDPAYRTALTDAMSKARYEFGYGRNGPAVSNEVLHATNAREKARRDSPAQQMARQIIQERSAMTRMGQRARAGLPVPVNPLQFAMMQMGPEGALQMMRLGAASDEARARTALGYAGLDSQERIAGQEAGWRASDRMFDRDAKSRELDLMNVRVLEDRLSRTTDVNERTAIKGQINAINAKQASSAVPAAVGGSGGNGAPPPNAAPGFVKAIPEIWSRPQNQGETFGPKERLNATLEYIMADPILSQGNVDAIPKAQLDAIRAAVAGKGIDPKAIDKYNYDRDPRRWGFWRQWQESMGGGGRRFPEQGGFSEDTPQAQRPWGTEPEADTKLRIKQRKASEVARQLFGF